jgi:membrane associated rhomboid family serine protease
MATDTNTQPQVKQEGFSRLEECLFITGALLALIVAIHALRTVGIIDTYSWGIFPREEYGMRGVFLAPLVHSNIRHLLSNAAPLAITLFSLLFFYPKVAMRGLMMIWFFTGVAVWLLAGKAWHIGASGVVYGLVSFLFWSGVFRKNKKSIVLALVMLILYSGMFEGILPNEPGISWESHLYGSLVGIFAAWWFKAEIEEDEVEQKIVFEQTEKQIFLPLDAFEKTKAQRYAEEQERQRLAFIEQAQRQAEEQERMRQSLLQQGYPPFYYTTPSQQQPPQ